VAFFPFFFIHTIACAMYALKHGDL